MFVANLNAGVSRWPIVRVQVRGVTEVILLGGRMLPLSVHWLGRSVICAGDCCALDDYLPARGVYYLPVVWGASVSILELAAQSSSHLEQLCSLLHGGMRAGLKVRISRKTPKASLYSEVIGFSETTREVDFLDFASRVMAIYHLPPANPSDTIESYESRVRLIAVTRANHEALKLKSLESRAMQSRV